MVRLRGDETDLFARHHARLRYHVATYTRAADEACSFAWVQFLRHQPDRDSVAGWLWRVAVRETHRLQAVERRQQALHVDRSEACDVIGPRHRWLEAMESLSALRPRQRRLLGLRACGCDYDEISAATGDSWRTIDRQLVRARKRLAPAS
jgi:DNA-directed RNA polymerase specialized sigma24 family protein